MIAFRRTYIKAMAAAFCAASVLKSCHYIDDKRVPVAPVNIEFPTVAQWNIYGVAAATDYQYFILDKRQPANFPYTASSSTGFGGVLLISDVHGIAHAYDLSCPVECKRDVRIKINKETMLAHCDDCGSDYDVFSLEGYPVAGVAAERGYGLRRYYVGPGRDGMYMTVNY